ncbi:protein of unknown function DUF208 [Coriobacterium glomerans PW2]|uniref:Epoxyqueuosine reductase QueH n=1 Tax=Coriobacterium glomerans (strain ATCC 49209 / DSM 20642 / JCM 10262 / PW2) TaxID=700015 RepID=F2N874_CORGP|nr:epoxyqueuosine reductase QueH [Coriobacterium glomerans]AEB07257.1 protein of unknown function DUF208 [Coriobacterium glomerans PW2]
MRRLLLHACCAPCALEPLRALRAEGFDPIICWANPNIQPPQESARRLEELRRWTARARIRLIETHEDTDAWERLVAPIGALDRTRRCRACYSLRLARACRVALDQGCTHVATTLAVSPYQLLDVCNEELERLSRARGLVPVVRDFRPWYPRACLRSRELGMYRQRYCGCRFSAAEAALGRARMREQRRAARDGAGRDGG